jgi:DNA mismatch repair ATPase MutL
MSPQFIIDQHASDEKNRYETLQATTVMNGQPLFAPLRLEVTAAAEVTIREHLKVGLITFVQSFIFNHACRFCQSLRAFATKH